MTVSKLYNGARMTTATTSTGTITLGSAVSGFLTFAQAGVADGDTVSYSIKDGVQLEIGRGVYTSSGTTLTRSVLKSTNSNSAINLSGAAEVMITALAEDFITADPTFGSDNTLVRKDGTGKLLQSTGITVDDSNNVSGVVDLTASGKVVAPTVVGGTATGSTLTLQSTTGVGSGDAIDFKVGNNGGTVGATINGSGHLIARSRLAVGANFTPSVTLHVRTATDNNFEVSNTTGGVSFQALNDARNSYRIMNFDADVTTFKRQSSDRLIVQNATVEVTVPILLKTYTVSTLPTGAAGHMAFTTNLRVSGQGVGAGTGGIASHNGTSWQVAGTSTTAAA